MKSLIEIVLGLMVLVAVIFLLTYSSWLTAFFVVLRGGVIALLFVLAIGLLLLGFSEL